jgi:hypothetical protein
MTITVSEAASTTSQAASTGVVRGLGLKDKIHKGSMVWFFRLVSLVVFISVKALILVRPFGFVRCPSLVRRELV